jgi:RNA recognition motif-containing protein
MANKTVYVGNLPYSVNESQLAALFSEFGGNNARIVDGRGFGFVDVDEDKLSSAIEATNSKDVDGRKIMVNEARPRENRSNHSANGGYRPSGRGKPSGGGRRW